MPINLEVNKRLLRDLYAALDAQDYDRVSEFLAEDALVYVVGTDVEYSKEAIMEFVRTVYAGFPVRTVYAGFPDFTHVIDEIYAEGNLVAVRLTYHGTHQGDYRGLPATGNTVTYGGAAFFTVLDGQLKEVWLVDDNLSLMQQIGMELVPTATNN
jgi:steroid delta-isomerase-like uncharacterized protein